MIFSRNLALWSFGVAAVLLTACSDDSLAPANSETSSKTSKLNCGPVPADEDPVTTYKVTYDSIVDARDGRVYKTVTYWSFMPESGPFDCEEFSQTWMAENLNYADSVKTPSLAGSTWCYSNDDANCEKGGRLYTWAAAIDSVKLSTDKDEPLVCGFSSGCFLLSHKSEVQGICPDGWHIPSDSDWDGVKVHPEEDMEVVGKTLKSTTGWSCDACNGTDSYGFNALPVGMWNGNMSQFTEEGKSAYFWTSREEYNYEAIAMVLKHNSSKISLDYVQKRMGLSIRCVKNGVTSKKVDKPSDVFFE